MAQSKYILTKYKKIAQNSNLAGAKAQNLARMSLAGISVPEFIVITTRAFAHRAGSSAFFTKLFRKRLEQYISNDFLRVAARSSSPLEDQQQHSFAGLYDTLLNLGHVDDIFAAVNKIWQSAEKEYIAKYAEKMALIKTPPIAVIVQRMIHATVSGVLFTAHPISRHDDVMLLEIVDGGCEKLVSGDLSPVKVLIDKSSHAITVESCGEHSENALRFLRNDARRQHLVELGVKIEKLFGAPQDIEWAFDGSTLWIMQSRPISTLYLQNPNIFIDASGKRWSHYFFAERFVQPLSPLGWSYLAPLICKTALQDPLWFLGYDKMAANAQLRLVRGLPFATLDAYQKLYSHIPWSLISKDKRQALALNESMQKKPALRNLFYLATRLSCRDVGWLPPLNVRQWKHFSRVMENKTQYAMKKIKNMDPDQCYAMLLTTHRWSLRFLQIHRWSITFADIFTALLKAFLIRLNLQKDIEFKALISGLPNNATVQANQALYFLDEMDTQSIQRFVEKFGHRSESLDVANPTWEEDVPRLIKTSALLKEHRIKFTDNMLQNQKERQQAESQVIAKIKQNFPVQQGVLIIFYRLLLYYVQQFTMLRENQRNLWHKILRISRICSIQFAKKLVQHNKIDQSGDIFYLTLSDLQQDQKLNRNDTHLKSLIAHRKSRHQRLQNEHSDNKQKAKPESERMTLSGIAVSAGRNRGKARIARNYNEAMQAQPGDILVVPAADPAWSPIFGIVSGLIMERGGVLSHASIVAREFRLPAITSVLDATHRIKNGDVIEIDGTAGVVHLLGDKSEVNT